MDATPPAEHKPYVPDHVRMPEFTWSAVLLGSVLGIIFGASSLYLVLKVGMTVSASIPVAVLSITLFRAFSRAFGVRRATILENNIVQTAGSAGESIAFGVGVTMPALLLLGFEMDASRVMVVAVLGGLLGILMMIPLRRAFIVKQHGVLPYPEGTACADVLIAGEKGGATAKTVFVGFGIALVHKFLMKAMHLWKEEANQPLWTTTTDAATGATTTQGLKGAVIGGELSPELMGVGYVIGPKIASIVFAGGVLAYLVLAPAIVLFATHQSAPLPPATASGASGGLIPNMSVSEIRNNYILYIGAGAVATGGIISMFQALPMIWVSLRGGLRDLRGGRDRANGGDVPRTQQDLPMSFVLLGTIGMVLALAALPGVGLGFSLYGIIGAILIVFFGFLFVTVSSRLTGQIGSSSNPISGMTVATLLLTCLIFLALSEGKPDKMVTLTALTIAAVVCIAASNGGTTAQDLKTGYLVGGTPRLQQWAIIIGALTSALVMGVTLLLLNDAGTIYTKRPEYLPEYRVPADKLAALELRERPGGQYKAEDTAEYRVLNVAADEIAGVQQGKYLVDDDGRIRYYVDPAINGRVRVQKQDREVRARDDGEEIGNSFEAPKTRLMQLIIDGILNQKLPWEMVLIGALIAITLELVGVPSLPFAVGVYLPIQTSLPIFIGGLIRWAVDKTSRRSAAEAEMSPGVLLSSGYIAGGAIAGVIIAFFAFLPEGFNQALNMSERLSPAWAESNWPTLAAFSLLGIILFATGREWLFKSEQP